MSDLPAWTTHLAVFVLGVATWLPFTLWEGRRVTHPEEPPVNDPETAPPAPTRRSRTSRLAIIILVASALLIGFGVQQGIYQHEQNEQAKCIAAYNATVETVRDRRIDAQDRLDQAQEAKDNANDNVLLTVLALRRQPPEAVIGDLDRVLTEFAAARAKRDRIRNATETVVAENPYPTLAC